MTTPILASTLKKEARSLLGVPWRHRGRNPRRGLDCIGLVLCVYSAAGWAPRCPHSTGRLDYDRLSSEDMLIQILEGEANSVSLGNKNELFRSLQSGDVLVFRFPGHQYVQHVGLVGDADEGAERVTLIHCRASSAKADSRVVEHALGDEWLEALDCAYRLDEVVCDEAVVFDG